LIHGTGQDKADGIGMMVTHGCMRMYPEDVAQLFPKVSVGTQVNLVYQSVKVGWRGPDLYIEVSQPLDEDHLGYDKLQALAKPLIEKKTADRPGFVLNQDALKQALRKPNGIPTIISGGTVTAGQSEKIPVMSRNPSVDRPADGTAPPPPPPAIAPAPAPVVAKPAPVPEYRPATPAPSQATPAPVVPHIPAQTSSAPPPRPVAQTSPAAPPAQRMPPAPAPAAPSASSRREEQLLPPIY
ncbi:MAG: L,D-transpeptidase, partial [Candidatus Methylumidiphilus sp.]